MGKGVGGEGGERGEEGELEIMLRGRGGEERYGSRGDIF